MRRVEKRQETDEVVDQHIHFYIIAIVLSIVKLGFTWMNIQDINIFKIDHTNIIFLVEVVSIPLSVINPSAWFSIFMTSLAIMCSSTGYSTFAICAVALMFGTLYISEICKRQNKVYEENNTNVYQVLTDIKPLVDKKLFDQII